MNIIAANNFLKHETVNAAEAIRFAVAGCDVGKVLVARSRMGVCSILLGTNAEELEIELGKIFPDDVFVRDERAVKEDMFKILRFFCLLRTPGSILRSISAARPSNARSGRHSAPFRRVGRSPSRNWLVAFRVPSRSGRSARPAPTIRSPSLFPAIA